MANKDYNELNEALFDKYFSETASDDEDAQLKQIIEKSSDLKKEFDESEQIIDWIEDLNQMKQVNTLKAFSFVKSKIDEGSRKTKWFVYWQKIAAVLIIPFIILSLFQQFKHHLKSPSTELVYNEISTYPGLRSVFKLPDGTTVWLNSNTTIKYPIAFEGNERLIKLEGEAYFKVHKDKAKPFIVDVGNLTVEAVGTEFNCMAYRGENVIETTLTEGVVKVTQIQNGERKGMYILNPGEVLIYENDSEQFYLEKEGSDKHVSWRSGKFIFRNDPLEEVFQKLERWFNADIEIQDEQLKTYSLTGTFEDEGLNEILDLISISTPIKYEIEKRKINGNNQYGRLKIKIRSKK